MKILKKISVLLIVSLMLLVPAIAANAQENDTFIDVFDLFSKTRLQPSIDGDTLNIKYFIDTEKVTDDITIIVATYDENGAFVGVVDFSSVPNEVSGEYNVALTEGVNSVKCFMFERAGFAPLVPAKEVAR